MSEPTGSTAHRVIKNTGFLYAKMGITMFISLYTTRLILNSLGASDFGIFNIVGGAIAMLGFLNGTMASATQRFMSYSAGEGDKNKQTKIFNISIVLHFCIALTVGVVLLIAGWFFFHGILNIAEERIDAAKVVYASLIISTIFTVMSVPYDAVLNAHENMLYYSIVGIIESILKLSVALAVVMYGGDKLILYGVLMAGIPLVTMTIMRIYCHKHYAECVIAPKQYWDKDLMKKITGFAGWNFIGSMSSIVGNYGNGMVINHFFGTIINAAIGVATQLNGQLMVFSNNLLKAINPVITKKEGNNERTKMLKYSFTGSKISFYLFAFFAIPSIIEAPVLLKLWLKSIPDWSIVFFRYQLLRTLLEQITVLFGTSLAATGEIKGINLINSICNLLPIPILYILFTLGFSPYWFYWVIIVFMVFFESCVKIYFCTKKCDLILSEFFNYLLFPSLISILLSISFGYCIILFSIGIYFQLIACILTTTVVLFSYSYFYFNSEEKQILYTLLNKIISLIIK